MRDELVKEELDIIQEALDRLWKIEEDYVAVRSENMKCCNEVGLELAKHDELRRQRIECLTQARAHFKVLAGGVK